MHDHLVPDILHVLRNPLASGRSAAVLLQLLDAPVPPYDGSLWPVVVWAEQEGVGIDLNAPFRHGR